MEPLRVRNISQLRRPISRKGKPTIWRFLLSQPCLFLLLVVLVDYHHRSLFHSKELVNPIMVYHHQAPRPSPQINDSPSPPLDFHLIPITPTSINLILEAVQKPLHLLVNHSKISADHSMDRVDLLRKNSWESVLHQPYLIKNILGTIIIIIIIMVGKRVQNRDSQKERRGRNRLCWMERRWSVRRRQRGWRGKNGKRRK